LSKYGFQVTIFLKGIVAMTILKQKLV